MKRNRLYRVYEGYDWFTAGAQKGVYQPPYCIRYRGRWYRTLPLSAAPGEPCLSKEDHARINALGKLDFGMRRCMDYLEARNKRFSDLPLITIDNLPKVPV